MVGKYSIPLPTIRGQGQQFNQPRPDQPSQKNFERKWARTLEETFEDHLIRHGPRRHSKTTPILCRILTKWSPKRVQKETFEDQGSEEHENAPKRHSKTTPVLFRILTKWCSERAQKETFEDQGFRREPGETSEDTSHPGRREHPLQGQVYFPHRTCRVLR